MRIHSAPGEAGSGLVPQRDIIACPFSRFRDFNHVRSNMAGDNTRPVESVTSKLCSHISAPPPKTAAVFDVSSISKTICMTSSPASSASTLSTINRVTSAATDGRLSSTGNPPSEEEIPPDFMAECPVSENPLPGPRPFPVFPSRKPASDALPSIRALHRCRCCEYRTAT